MGYSLSNVGRGNLRVLTEALATKLTLSETVEVSFRNSDVLNTVDVKKKIILIAGVVKTPHIIELSGTGDSDVLKSAGVGGMYRAKFECGTESSRSPYYGPFLRIAGWRVSLDMLQDPKEVEKAMG